MEIEHTEMIIPMNILKGAFIKQKKNPANS